MRWTPAQTGAEGGDAVRISKPWAGRSLDTAAGNGDLKGDMARTPKILLPTLPAPARRVAGFWLLTLSLWLASILALFR